MTEPLGEVHVRVIGGGDEGLEEREAQAGAHGRLWISAKSAEEIAAKPDQTWPLVRRHPVTGAKSVYVNPKNTRAVVRRDSGARLAPDAAKTLVETLGRRVVDSGVYAHEWRRGDFVIWDNRVLLHAASPFDAEAHQRLLFRMEFKGEPVLGP